MTVKVEIFARNMEVDEPYQRIMLPRKPPNWIGI